MRAAILLTGALNVLTLQSSWAAAQPDGFYGTWTLDRARSHYAREAPPETMTVTIEPAPAGLAYRSEARFGDGRANSSHFVARLDKTPAVVLGTTGLLAPVSLAVADEATIEAVYTSGRRKVAWSRWSVNEQRTEMWVTTTYLGPDGEENQNVAAFLRSGTAPRAST